MQIIVDWTGYPGPRGKGTTSSAWTGGGQATLARVTVAVMLTKSRAMLRVWEVGSPYVIPGNQSCRWTVAGRGKASTRQAHRTKSGGH